MNYCSCDVGEGIPTFVGASGRDLGVLCGMGSDFVFFSFFFKGKGSKGRSGLLGFFARHGAAFGRRVFVVFSNAGARRIVFVM